MPELKTRPTNVDASEFIDAISSNRKKEDTKKLLQTLKDITGEPPKMWGPSIIGFGNYHFKYESGRELDWFLAGFSPRKQSLTIYMMGGFEGTDDLLAKLGKHKKSVGCLYINKLEDINYSVLEEMIVKSIDRVKKKYAVYN